MHARRRLRTLSGHVLATAGTASLGAAAPSDAEASGGPAPAAGAPLSPQQVEHYRTFGFVNLPGCLLPELPALEREHAAALAGSFGDEQPSSRQTVRMLRDDFPTFNALPESCGNLAGGLGAVAEQLYGPDMCAIHRASLRLAWDRRLTRGLECAAQILRIRGSEPIRGRHILASRLLCELQRTRMPFRVLP